MNTTTPIDPKELVKWLVALHRAINSCSGLQSKTAVLAISAIFGSD
ncbi:hypothetical protein [Pseudomonas marginalis]|nr:hypothetical protein [Pseudomonas marginalis]WPN23988.1 hypothetical protein QMK57_01175 [Pseudomonas marginalis]